VENKRIGLGTIMLNDRQQQIVELITIEREIRVSELKKKFDVTEMTIRRDLEKLEQQGILRRTFGGAIQVSKDIALHERTVQFIDEKKRIGKKAASIIQAGESIYIDGGSTTLEVARFLKPDMSLTVVTNALNVAVELLEKKIPAMMVGGIIIEKTASLVGPLAAEGLSKMAFDRVFLGATGVNVQHGFSNSNMYEADLKRLAINRASNVNVVIDFSKFGVKSLVSFADFSMVNTIFTDKIPPAEFIHCCDENDVELNICSEMGVV